MREAQVRWEQEPWGEEGEGAGGPRAPSLSPARKPSVRLGNAAGTSAAPSLEVPSAVGSISSWPSLDPLVTLLHPLATVSEQATSTFLRDKCDTNV